MPQSLVHRAAAIALVTAAFGSAVFAAPTVSGPRDRAVEQFQKLDRPAQELWLRALFDQRMHPATEGVLKPEELERQRAFESKVLRKFSAGQKLSPDGLGRLLAAVDKQEQAAIDHFARLYRVEVYGAFHTNRTEYDRRMKAWQRVLDAWDAAGGRSEDRQQLIRWLQSSIERMQAGQIALLPAIPRFGQPTITPQPPRQAPLATREPVARQAAPLERKRNLGPPKVAAQPPAVKLPAAKLPAASPARSAGPVAKPKIHSDARKIAAAKVDTANGNVSRRPLAGTPSRTASAQAAVPKAPLPKDRKVIEQPNGIDLDELSARVGGYNLAISGLVARLSEHERVSTRQLAEATRELEDLAQRRADLLLYLGLLPARDRRSIGTLDPADTLIAVLGAKISALRNQLEDPAEEGSASARKSQLDELSRLSKRLAALASTVGGT